MRRQRTRVQRLGVCILDHSPLLELLVDGNGAVVGGRGVDRRSGEDYEVRAGAVVLATGGCAFQSRTLGCDVDTGDGALLAAEVGAQLSGMEFSNAYAIAPSFTSVTKTAYYSFGTFDRSDGSVLEGAASQGGRSVIARTLLHEPVLCRLDKADEATQRAIRLDQPNFLLPFDRQGIDPFTDLFPITLVLEGTVRGTGGVRVHDDDRSAGVPGLYVAGDTATRELICGGFTGGGSHNAAWAISSGSWAGRAAADRAARTDAATAPAVRRRRDAAARSTGRRIPPRKDTTMTQIIDDTTQTVPPGDYRHLDVLPVGLHIGAEVRGLVAAPDLDPAFVVELRRALLAHKVVFLRDQHGVDDAAQWAFAAQLGVLTAPHPTVAGEDGVLPIDSEYGKANSWHTDVTFVDRIPAISVLRAVTLPPFGGTTVWANTVRAYETLHSGLQALADRLWAVHSNLYDYAADRDEQRIGGIDVKEQAYREEFRHLEFETEHPLVRVHPETGERALLLGHFVRRLVGLSSRDSQELFGLLQRHVTSLENTVRWSWRLGDIAIWDNRATQHYAVDDYGDFPRVLHRVTVAGDVPVSVDGVASTARSGDASHYSPIAVPA
jgi:alpha-ketoglutarate-dependent sulfate ester dioxygenase